MAQITKDMIIADIIAVDTNLIPVLSQQICIVLDARLPRVNP